MNTNLSIFNDVIGPVMRGPSSSHTAASWRIARVCLDILNEPLKKAVIEFDENGAWAANYLEQGTVMGINGGLLGLDIIDDKMKYTESLAKDIGIDIRYQINSFPTKHTNTVRLMLEGKNGKRVQFVAASIGGGAFEIQQIDNFHVKIRGDYFELIIWKKNNRPIPEDIKKIISQNILMFQSSDKNRTLINLKSSKKVPLEIITKLKENSIFDKVIIIHPVLPILSGNENELPFNTIASLLEHAEKNKHDLGDVGLIYEKCQSGLSKRVLINKMKNIIKTIEGSIETGLKGTLYKDRILHQQSHFIGKAEKDGKILKTRVVNNIISYVTAIMEAKSAMEVIVANPTAGSCGTIGGALKGIAEDLNSTSGDVVKAYFAAGIIGVYFARGPGFSAEEYGCQVECGAASGMAAAGIVQLMGGTAREAIGAASLAIQNMIGLICDPVADRVEVPCLGKNISAAMNALSSAIMARSGFDAVIPLEEVIQTVVQVGKQMPACVKCTGKGGLSVTVTSTQIKEKLKN
ncbi:MAG: L-serine ammonia-lyase, iron-sulfur-dependent, subunit alpha [bacterium]|nr:MAG: L-serine ammonia-lyase, iron-sulfur-dependent, subunit alpha [bacterium]